MLIGELAEAVGLPISTIRFYERRGLLDDAHMDRHGNNYRVYNAHAVERLTLIKQMQRAGITLNEIHAHIANYEADAYTAAQKCQFFSQKLALVLAQIDAMREVEGYLREKLAQAQAEAEQHAQAQV